MKTVLVSGASSGIGRAIAYKLHRQGYQVFGTSRKPKKITEALPYKMLPLDVSSRDSVQECLALCLAKAGKVDILINNAGFAHMGCAEEMSEKEARFQVETNFWGYVRMSQAVLPHMRQQQSGKIIQISSLGGSIGIPMQAFYAASKHAVEGYTKSLRMEVKPFNIKVVLLKPGFIRTNMHASFMYGKKELPEYHAVRESVHQEISESLQKGDPVEKVADKVYEILRKRNPAIYYSIGTSGRLLPILYSLFPRLFEFGSMKKFGLDKLVPG
ncbi:SDR family NAD(P)-dependent oxidoreductase [Catalinimonas sp. 4WD22]|uniref:SDR family NAD(P)-dependent oxidoreductase n=1 Tax=Catalinimonas locisalis TaxID=3133978 RepID=UPI003100D7EB